MVVNKHGIFRPAGGEHAFCVSNRVTRITYQELRGACSNRAFHPMESSVLPEAELYFRVSDRV